MATAYRTVYAPADANAYERAVHRMGQARLQVARAREVAERVTRHADAEYAAAEAALRECEVTPGIPLPEYR